MAYQRSSDGVHGASERVSEGRAPIRKRLHPQESEAGAFPMQNSPSRTPHNTPAFFSFSQHRRVEPRPSPSSLLVMDSGIAQQSYVGI
jgi:hypothetical protein